MGRMTSATVLAVAAAVLAFASAAVSVYWTLGGTALLDTVGGAIEELARTRTAAGIALVMGAVAAKVIAGLLALTLVRASVRRWWVAALNGAASVALVLWGGGNVVLGGLVLTGAIVPSTPVDEHALRWHVAVWDLWFLVWGVCLGLAVLLYRRPREPVMT